MKKLVKSIIKFFQSIHTWLWCLFHFVKYKKGCFVGHGVKKERGVKLFLSKNCRISHHTLLWGTGRIEIGENSSIGSWSRIYASKEAGVKIGNNSMSASHLYVIDSNHGTKSGELIMKQPMLHKPVIIGDDVWLGYHTTILMGVTLEDGCITGACSVVTKSFKNNSIVAGVPAKLLRYRE